MKKSKSGLIIGIAAGVIVIAAAVVLLLLLRDGEGIAGVWRCEELNQVLRLYEDKTAVMETPQGIYAAAYIYDKEAGQGSITVNGESLPFTFAGGKLTLEINGGESIFERGDMKVVPGAEATPPPAETTPTPAETAPAPVQTATDAPAETATDSPAEAATDAAETATEAPAEVSAGNNGQDSEGPTPNVTLDPAAVASAMIAVNPGIDVPGNLRNISIIGGWLSDTRTTEIKFLSGGIYRIYRCEPGEPPLMVSESTYTYSMATGEGLMDGSISITLEGDLITLSTGKVYFRNAEGVGNPIIGSWFSEDESYRIDYDSDGTYETIHYRPGMNPNREYDGPYRYNPVTGEGSLLGRGSFTVEGDIMTFDSGDIYHRD